MDDLQELESCLLDEYPLTAVFDMDLELGGDAIEVRRGEPGKATSGSLLSLDDAEGVPALVVREQINEVWRALSGGGRRGVTESRPGGQAKGTE